MRSSGLGGYLMAGGNAREMGGAMGGDGMGRDDVMKKGDAIGW